jgi:hypothetical protein
MGKSDEKQTKKRAHHKATETSKHAATGERKHKQKSCFDTTLGGSPFEIACTDNDGGLRHSQWCDLFRQLCEFKVQNGHCRVPQQYSANPKLGKRVSKQCRKNTEEYGRRVNFYNS